MSVNVCEGINCPYFATAEEGFGCQKYMVALHCHLVTPKKDVHRSGFEASTQYALYAENPDIPALKLENENYLRIGQKYLDDVSVMGRGLTEKKFPKRFL